MRIPTTALACALTIACGIASASAAGTPTPDPAAIDAVKHYVAALAGRDPQNAYPLLTPAQRRYFRNARNFASNYATTGYRIVSYSIVKTTMRNPNLAQVDVTQTASFFNIAAARATTARVTEPYFALRTNGTWGVKEIYEPWKSYAPNASGRAGGLEIVVNRIEFFDRRVQVDCTFRNKGTKPVQVLPLLQSSLQLGGPTAAAMNSADFPLNDRHLFEGARIYPFHQLVGYLNFPRTSRDDVDLSATLVVRPVVEDGAQGPASVTVGPMQLPKL